MSATDKPAFSVLGASPLKKPKAPSSLRIILKQSNMPLYFWTLPNVSLASWNPCIFSSGKKKQQKQKLKLWNIYFTRAKFTSARGYNYKDLKSINQLFSVKTEAEVSRWYDL